MSRRHRLLARSHRDPESATLWRSTYARLHRASGSGTPDAPADDRDKDPPAHGPAADTVPPRRLRSPHTPHRDFQTVRSCGCARSEPAHVPEAYRDALQALSGRAAHRLMASATAFRSVHPPSTACGKGSSGNPPEPAHAPTVAQTRSPAG